MSPIPPPPPPPGDSSFPQHPGRTDGQPVYGQPVYGQQMYGQPGTGQQIPVQYVVAVKTNGLAVASMVLGIVGVILCFLWIPSILAVVFGAVALRQIADQPMQGGKAMAIAGLTTGLVGLAIVLVLMLAGNAPLD